MRLERSLHIREELEEQHEENLANGWRVHFDPAKPWDAVWKQMANHEKDFWDRHVKDPAHNIGFGLRTEQSYLGGDANIAHAALPGFGVMEEPPPTSTYQRPAKKHKKLLALPYYENGGGDQGGQEEHDLSAHDGTRYTLTKKGFEMCKGFQNGTCQDTGDNNMCWHSSAKAHQCSWCLKTGHGEHNCWTKKQSQGKGKSNPVKKGKGGGKKGGKKGGKGKKA